MKFIKTLGLAAIAAVALLAVLGAATASATTLKNATENLKAGSVVKAKLESGTNSVMTTKFKNIECEASEITAGTTNETGGAVFANVELTFGKCNCEVKVLSGGTLTIIWINGTPNGELTSSGTEVTTTCSSIFGTIHCIYRTASNPIGTLTGSEATGGKATIDINEANIPRMMTNANCDEKGSWDAKYLIENPETLNVIN